MKDPSQEPPSLFEVDDESRPLADRLRPRELADVVGQQHLLGPDGPLGRMVGRGKLVSTVLWGPPVAERPQSRGCSLNRPVSSSSRSRPHSLALLTYAKCFLPPSSVEKSDRARCCLSMRYIDSIVLNRIHSCPMSRTAPLCWWVQRRKTRALS